VATGRISGERDAGLTVREGWVSRGEAWALMDDVVSAESRGPKRSCEKVTGRGDWCGDAAVELPRKTAMVPVNCSSSRWSMRFLASRSAKRISRSWFRRSIAVFWASRASTSCRLRSLDDWAARRLRRTRSTRRCSFSSSVFARFLPVG
jgi:hypothetical protein